MLGRQLAKHKAVLINYIYLERMIQCRRAYNMRVGVWEGEEVRDRERLDIHKVANLVEWFATVSNSGNRLCR